MSTGATYHSKQIVINWHVTEACNFRCGYCYAHWQEAGRRDLIRDGATRRALMTALYDHFRTLASPVRPRLNFAGGEPLLFVDEVLLAMAEAIEIGFEVSVITNGSRIGRPVMEAMAPMLSVLGISLDSTNTETMTSIGRQDARGHQVALSPLLHVLTTARLRNPRMALKVNTVVCRENWHEDMSAVIRQLAPDRWKVLRMLPVIDRDLAVTDAQFHAFVASHREFARSMSIEDNDDMQASYIMVDPAGRFFQNRPDTSGYVYSPPILEVGAAQAFGQMGWSAVKFERRYRAAGKDTVV